MGVGDALNQLDAALSGLIGQWNGYSTGLVTLLIVVISYSIMGRVDPDVHPMLLARQAQGSPVRQEGESPVYRGNSAPHGMALNSGLNVKPPGASKWALGKDGDLRDVWRRVVSGSPEEGGPSTKGKLLTVLGRERVTEHRISMKALPVSNAVQWLTSNAGEVTRAINLIGQHIAQHGGSKVAIYLPNSIEFLATLFACSFYDLTAIVLPFNEPADSIISMLRQSGADTVVTSPGEFPFDSVVKSYPSLKQLIWVVDQGSNHMDWNEVPQGVGGAINVSTWQDIINESPAAAGTELPAENETKEPNDVVFFWKSKSGAHEEPVKFTQKNLVAAISAQLTAVPTSHRLSSSDLFLSAVPLSASFPLILTLAALYSNASVAFNSVASPEIDLSVSTQGIAPTVVLATPETLQKTHNQLAGRVASGLASLAHWIQTRTLVQNGAMPVASLFTSINDGVKPVIGTTPGKLRLLYVADSAGAGTPVLSERTLSDLRIFTGARVVYALTAAQVAGAIAQTQFNDYRVHGDGSDSHFGPPVSSVEVVLKDSGSHKTSDDGQKIEGEITVRGPAVAGGVASLGVLGKIRQDNTLAYL
jgi:acyl-CoA synthetase (AMP-forming)/AMP-acid ligase II